MEELSALVVMFEVLWPANFVLHTCSVINILHVSGVVEAAMAKDPNTHEYFMNEYQLNHLIASLDTPYVSMMDGITSTLLKGKMQSLQ